MCPKWCVPEDPSHTEWLQMAPVTINLCWDDPIEEEYILRWPQYLVMWSILTFFFLWFSPGCGAKAYYASYLCKRQRKVYTLLLSAFFIFTHCSSVFPQQATTVSCLAAAYGLMWLVDDHDCLSLIGWLLWWLEFDWLVVMIAWNWLKVLDAWRCVPELPCIGPALLRCLACLHRK